MHLFGIRCCRIPISLQMLLFHWLLFYLLPYYTILWFNFLLLELLTLARVIPYIFFIVCVTLSFAFETVRGRAPGSTL
jgi:hypothetical protein